MPRANDAVESALLEYADLLSILSEDRFRPRSYEKAARAVGGYPADIAGSDVKELQAIPNVGASIAEKIREFLQTGAMGALEGLRAQIPPGVRALMAIPGLGPKRAMVLYQELGVASVDELLAAVNEGRLAELPAPSKWHRWAVQAVQDDLLLVRRLVAEKVLDEAANRSVDDAVAAFLDSRSEAFDRLSGFMRGMALEDANDLAAMTVALRQVRSLAA